MEIFYKDIEIENFVRIIEFIFSDIQGVNSIHSDDPQKTLKCDIPSWSYVHNIRLSEEGTLK